MKNCVLWIILPCIDTVLHSIFTVPVPRTDCVKKVCYMHTSRYDVLVLNTSMIEIKPGYRYILKCIYMIYMLYMYMNIVKNDEVLMSVNKW